MQAKDADLDELQVQLGQSHRSEEQLRYELASSQQAARHTTALTQELSRLINNQAQLQQDLAASQQQAQQLQTELAASQLQVVQLEQRVRANQEQVYQEQEQQPLPVQDAGRTVPSASAGDPAAADVAGHGLSGSSEADTANEAHCRAEAAGDTHSRALNSWGSGPMGPSRRATMPSRRGTLEERPAAFAATSAMQAASVNTGAQGLNQLSTGGGMNLLGLPDWGASAPAEVRECSVERHKQ